MVEKTPPSVRVDHDVDDGGVDPASVPRSSQPDRPSAPKPLLVAVVGVVGLLIVATFVLIRPDSGEAADGSERQAPAPVTVAPEEDTESLAESTPAVDEPLAAQPIDLERGVREVVPSEIGLLATLNMPAPRAEPPIVRSIDGIDWRMIEAEVIEPDDLDLLRSRFASFVGLRTTNEGFTVLRTRQEFAEPGRTSTGRFVIDRLRSADGSLWTLDSSFEEIFVAQAIPFTAGGGELFLGVQGPVPMTSGVAVDGIREIRDSLAAIDCSPRGSSIDLLVLGDCDRAGAEAESDPAVLAAEECAAAFDRVAPMNIESNFRLVDSTGASGVFAGFGLLTSPQVVDSLGVVVALSTSVAPAPDGCTENFPPPRPIGVVVWDGPGLGRHVPLADLSSADVDEDELATAVSLGPLGDGVLIATVDHLIRIDVVGQVEVIGDLSSIDLASGVPAAFVVDDGVELVDVRDGVLRRWIVTETGVEITEEPVFEQSGFEQVRYLDSSVIITNAPDRNRAIRLAQG